MSKAYVNLTVITFITLVSVVPDIVAWNTVSNSYDIKVKRSNIWADHHSKEG
jgi:hypothetical protein